MICATGFITIPVSSIGVPAGSQIDNFCGKYLSLNAGDTKSGIVSCKFFSGIIESENFLNVKNIIHKYKNNVEFNTKIIISS